VLAAVRYECHGIACCYSLNGALRRIAGAFVVIYFFSSCRAFVRSSLAQLRRTGCMNRPFSCIPGERMSQSPDLLVRRYRKAALVMRALLMQCMVLSFA
jgi:hypothetical protein